jgi:hypothetical protein
MRTRSFLLAVAATLTLSAAGCGADTPTPAGDTAARDGGEPPAAAEGAYPAEDVCTYLQGEIPALKEIGSPVGRHANLAGKLATFFESHGRPANGAVLDAAVKAECPAVRTEVLTLIDVESFSSF